MFARTVASLYFILSLTILAAAMPWNTTPTPTPTKTVTVTAPPSPPKTSTITVTAPASTPSGGSTCSTGPVQCCNSVGTANDAGFGAILGLLGIVLDGVEGLLGLGCSPITVVGVGSGNACSSNVVCCQNNNVGGLISIGCIPIIL